MAKRGAGRRSVDWPLIRANVRAGVFIGLLMATGYSAWVSVVYVFGGTEAFSDTHGRYRRHSIGSPQACQARLCKAAEAA